MGGFDLHVHTLFCDGKNSAEEMVRAALDLKLDCLGFSGHSYTDFDESFCLSEENTLLYRQEIHRLQEKYRGKIRILCGIEQDLYSKEPTTAYDYIIGSVHYVNKNSQYLSVDESAEVLKEIIEQHYEGDFYALAADYYKNESQLLPATKADIIGHFDLVTKFCEHGILFDENDPRYVNAWQMAADALLPYGKVFEINTGAVSRGNRSSPYPSANILRYLKAHGGRVILSSDSHSADTLCYQFEEWRRFARDIGFRDFSMPL